MRAFVIFLAGWCAYLLFAQRPPVSAVFDNTGNVQVSVGHEGVYRIEPPIYDTGAACTMEPAQPMRVVPVGIIEVDHGARWRK